MEKPLAVDSPGIRRMLAANEEAKQEAAEGGRRALHAGTTAGYQETIAPHPPGCDRPDHLHARYWNMGSTARHRAATAAR